MTIDLDRAPYGCNVATLPAPDAREPKRPATNMSDRREETDRQVLVCLDPARTDDHPGGRLATVVDARWYMGRSSSASVVYCSVWVVTRDGRWITGRGSASGWGYHKASAAFQDALEAAGVRLEHRVDGRGDGAVEHAIYALGRAAGYGEEVGPWAIV